MKNFDKTIVLSRHLSTAANENNIIMGRKLDPEINKEHEESYRANIKALNGWIGERDKGKISFYSSPALRCVQTLKIAIPLLSYENKPFDIDDRLWETDCGEFSGKSVSQIRKDSPELLDLWVNHPEKMKFPGGESYEDVQTRANAWLRDVMDKDTDIVFAVTHVDVIKMIVFWALKLPISSKRLMVMEPGSVTVLGKRQNEIVLLNSNLFGGLM